MIRMPTVGDDFGRYRLVRELGRGGMGVVYVARDARLDREVALKIIAPQWAGDAEYRARFRREAAALSRMDSSHVVQVHDHGELDGCLFLVTQLVPDGDLMQRLERQGGLPPAVGVDVVMQVLAGLADAHRVGVVHRDVKPSNVLLRQRGEEVEAFLCDFGIASAPGEQVTRTGALVGSFPYMAPERHQGESAGVAGDIYSVGCVLWQVLTGTAPYAGTDVEIAMAHLQAPIPQLPETGPFAAGVNTVLRAALAKLPGERYPSAKAMRAELATLVAAAPPELTLPAATQVRHSVLPGVIEAATGSRASTTRRRRAAVVAAVSVAAVLIATAGVAAAIRGGEADRVATDPPPPTQTETVLQVPPSLVEGATFSAETPTAGTGTRPGSVRPGGGAGADPGGTVPPLTGGGGADGQGGSAGEPRSSSRPRPSPRPTPTAQQPAPPSPAPTSAPPAPPPTYRCWDGSKTRGKAACGYPTGTAGLRYVFKQPGGCRNAGGTAQRRAVLVCSASNGAAQVTYVEWTTVGAARDHFRGQYGESSGWRFGLEWRQETPKRNVVKRLAHLYQAGPYSALVEGTSRKAFATARDGVRYREPQRLRGHPLN